MDVIFVPQTPQLCSVRTKRHFLCCRYVLSALVNDSVIPALTQKRQEQKFTNSAKYLLLSPVTPSCLSEHKDWQNNWLQYTQRKNRQCKGKYRSLNKELLPPEQKEKRPSVHIRLASRHFCQALQCQYLQLQYFLMHSVHTMKSVEFWFRFLKS